MASSLRDEPGFPDEPLAIVGMSCRLPGADGLDGYWELIRTGSSGISEMPESRLNRKLFYTTEREQWAKTYSTISGLIPPRESDPKADIREIRSEELSWDPCHEILCGVVDEARLSAGWTKDHFSANRTGVYVGHSSGSEFGSELVLGCVIPEVADCLNALPALQSLSKTERLKVLSRLVENIQKQRPVRTDKTKLEANFAAQIVARQFELDGPQMVIDAACASSMIALALASAALTLNEIDVAVVSSASYAKADSLILFSQAQSCSATKSRPFDANADGLVNAEGYVTILVKTLRRAEQDGDRIQAVIRGIGISSDGKGRSLWAPRKEGQFEAVRRAYTNGISIDSVQYVEAHATSTQVGDATELEALALCFQDSKRPNKIPLGSVKSNIGHTLESAGLAGLVKAVLCMQKGMIPPTINLSELNSSVDWKTHPLAPVTSTIAWPDMPGQPRRSAVNSFGIGGLNAHVIVDGPLAATPASNPVHREQSAASKNGKPLPTHNQSGAMAIIGRGVIVPGAFSVDAFETLLSNGESQLCVPPKERWRGSDLPSSRPTSPADAASMRGGYIRGYEYDWRKHKIPPRQIENANPLQFMLLDAAQQALNESGYANREYDRLRTAVVVGTLFGGEFSHQQIVGLRLPEILEGLESAIGHSNIPLDKVLSEAETQILKSYSALQDQTGSFTSSTQASRVAKTLNVMGGAMAIDSGDNSSLAALQSAQHLLASGVVDFVFCAAAQRALDAVSFEAWNLRPEKRLHSRNSDGSLERVSPGEGVVVFLLRRLEDARTQNDKILGVIRDVRATRANRKTGVNGTVPRHETSSTNGAACSAISLQNPLMAQFGHLQAASGMLEILGATVHQSNPRQETKPVVVQTETDECTYTAIVESAQKPPSVIKSPPVHIPSEPLVKTIRHNQTEKQPSRQVHLRSAMRIEVPVKSAVTPSDLKLVRLWGVDESELFSRLSTADHAAVPFGDQADSSDFPTHAPFRLSIVTGEKEWARKKQIALEFLQNGGSLSRLQEHGIYFRGPSASGTPRIAFLFPGQGSQKVGMLTDLIQSSANASNRLSEIDRLLLRAGGEPCSSWICSENHNEEESLETTQVAMLAADMCAWEIVKEWGFEPDYLLGHSFGEYAALVSAGVIDLASAISITRARAHAVAECQHADGAMLSISAKVREIQKLVADRAGLFISHANSPQQTVVAGSVNPIREFAAEIKKLSIPALQVPVSSPFHTPLLESAKTKLQLALGQHRWRPPRVPVLSSVSGRFVADRDEIISNLTHQLTLPLNWIANIERLLEEDVQLFIEVGPGRVLTKLTQQIVGERQAFALPIDDPKLDQAERRLRIQAAMETIGIRKTAAATIPQLSRIRPQVDVTHFDVPSRHNIESLAERNSKAASEPVQSVTQSVAADDSARSLLQFLTDLVVEQTGFSADQIELDRDLEEDLGIDHTRKAQILGELREYFDLPTESQFDQLKGLRTLRDFLHLLEMTTGKGEWLLDSAANSKAADTHIPEAVPASKPQVSSAAVAVDDSRMDEFLIDFVVERTGYPRDVIELDVDLEADLGIDSIAKAQLIGEVRDHFRLTIDETATRAVLGEIRTLRQIREMMGTVSIKSDAPAPAPATNSSDSNDDHDDGLDHLSPRNGSSPLPVVPAPDRSESPVYTNGSHPGSAVEFDPQHSAAFERGVTWGRENRDVVRNRLFDRADQFGSNESMSQSVATMDDEAELTSIELAEYRGVAQGADVHELSILALRPNLESNLGIEEDTTDFSAEADDVEDVDGEMTAPLTQRFRLEMSPAETRKWSGRKPPFAGGSIVIGNSRDCEELVRRLEAQGQKVAWFREAQSDSVAKLEKLWEKTPSPHLFIMTPRDSTAKTCLDDDRWKHRRDVGITSIFWFCQKWLALAEKSKLIDDASLIGVMSMGGDFGISQRIESAESGALSGLLKAIMIETWVNGHRTTPIKLMDFPTDVMPASIVDAIFVELDEPSYDVEIGWKGTSRSVLRSIPDPLPAKPTKKLTPAGNWLVTGGARGITAYLVKQLANRYPKLHFHLIGTAPIPQLTEEQRSLAATAMAQLRTQCMQEAKTRNQSPIKAWQKLEKAIEIDQTLRELRSHGAQVSYHSADVANLQDLGVVVDDIRATAGPITGVIHGAGIGKDAGFQRKEKEMVDRCLSAKLDGAVNLMSLTQKDDLQAWIGFGSISGRFGANGHTDYSLANDMLAKLTTWYRSHRPDVPSAVFHWHAWDDIGMATKPETRLALEMIGMKLMPATEGANHFLREIEAGLPLAEVLITDTRYYRMFYPADRMVADGAAASSTNGYECGPLIRPAEGGPEGVTVGNAILNPITDPFLKEHRLRDRPLLPMVIMTELLIEGGAIAQKEWQTLVLQDFEIATSLKFPTDTPCEVQVSAKSISKDQFAAELRADFHSRNGKLVTANRLYASGTVRFDADAVAGSQRDQALPALTGMEWIKPSYPDASAVFYVGNPFRCLKCFAIDEAHRVIWGQISAPSYGELAGAERDVAGWLTPSAILDATLFTSGILGWKTVRPGVMLPQRVNRMIFLRRPRPAETCIVRSQLVRSDDAEAVFDITVWGNDGKPVFMVEGYVAAWLPS